MLYPCKKVDGAKYRDRDGSVYIPDNDATVLRREGAFVFISRQDKLLLVKPIDGEGFWEVPGGGIDQGETAHQAAVRETFEETGFKLQPENLEKVFEQRVYLYMKREPLYWNYDQYYFSVTDHTVDIFNEVKSSPEDGHLQWASRENIKNIPIKHSVIPALKASKWL